MVYMMRPVPIHTVMVLATIATLAAVMVHAGPAPAHALSDTLAIIETGSGRMVIEFFPEVAPAHVENFVTLAGDGFYSDTLFHRIIPGFMIQGGDPNTKSDALVPSSLWGTGGPDHTVDAEFNDLQHVRGIVSMARSQDPNSAGSQFFIVHANSPHLDGSYTAFGRLVTADSFVTLDAIAALETDGTTPVDLDAARVYNIMIVPSSEIDTADMPTPPRVATPTTLFGDELYENTRLGIQFAPPVGWFVQEQPKTSPDIPDVALLSQGPAGTPRSISITITPAPGLTLEDKIMERNMAIQASVTAGQITLISAERTQIAGRDAYLMHANGTFEWQAITIPVNFKEITYHIGDRFFSLTYAAHADDFETSLAEYDTLVDTFAVPAAEATMTPNDIRADTDPDTMTQADTPPPTPPPDTYAEDTTTSVDDNGCLIATAAYGTELAPQVQMLRELRDDTILQTASGTAFMSAFNHIYYTFSPSIADMERQNAAFRELTRAAITPMLASLSLLQHAEIESELGMISYGGGVLALIMGMYVATPVLAARKITSMFRAHRNTA